MQLFCKIWLWFLLFINMWFTTTCNFSSMGSDPPLWPLWALALMGTYIPTQIYIIKIKKMSFPKIRVFVPSMPLNRVGKRCKGEDEKAESRCCGGRWSHTRIKKEQCDFACNSYVAQRKGASWSTWPEKTIFNLLFALTKNPGPVPGTCIWQPLRPCNSSSRVYLTHSSELLRHPDICVYAPTTL